MRLLYQGKGASGPEAQYHPDDATVDATGTWHEGHASYLGRSGTAVNKNRLPTSECAGKSARSQQKP